MDVKFIESNSEFDAVFTLMQESFPDDEYRPYKEQYALLQKPEYRIYCAQNANEELIAFLAVWDFEPFLFLEHFAVKKEYRSNGLGSILLQMLQKKVEKPLVLEAEPPESPMQRRRIAFYERNGFFLSEEAYVQPAISHGKQPVKLVLMSTSGKLEGNSFLSVKNTLYSHVYGLDL